MSYDKQLRDGRIKALKAHADVVRDLMKRVSQASTALNKDFPEHPSYYKLNGAWIRLDEALEKLK